MKKLLFTLLLFTFSLTLVNTVNASDKSFINEQGVYFKNSEIIHLKKIGVSDLEISILTEQEKDYYLSKKADYSYSSEIYEKIEKVKKIVDGKEVTETIKTKIDKKTAESYKEDINSDVISLSRGFEIVIEDGGGGGGTPDDIGPTYNQYDTSDISVRKLTLSASYNYTTDYMFVKVTVDWYAVPNDRGWDIINISHTADKWFIETVNTWNPNINAYEQEIRFEGKQIYDWTEYDNIGFTHNYGDTTRVTISYNQDLSSSYYENVNSRGIALKQNLKNDDLDTNWSNEYMQYVTEGYKVTDLQLTLEAEFENIDSNTNGIFYGGALHQESYVTIDLSDIYFTYMPPYISVPTGFLQWGNRYEDDGLGVDINVPIS